jgi:hypothetical protein
MSAMCFIWIINVTSTASGFQFRRHVVFALRNERSRICRGFWLELAVCWLFLPGETLKETVKRKLGASTDMKSVTILGYEAYNYIAEVQR